MKKHIYYNILGIILFLTTALAAHGQHKDEKSMTHRFPLTEDGQLVVTNMHGNISINGWDKDSVVIVIDIAVDSDEKNLIDRIQPEVDYSQEYVEATTVLAPISTGFWRTLWNDINPIEVQRRDMKINYTIHVPAGADLTLTNKYGDIVIEGCHGKLDANVEHGDVRISEELRFAKVNIEFGKFRAHTLERGDIILRSGRLDLSTVNVLELNSQGSDIEMNTVNTLDLTSKSDDVNIETVSSIKGSARYGELDIEQLASFFDLRLHHNNCQIRSIASSDTEITVNQVSSEFELHTNDVGVNIAANMEAGLLRLPKDVENLDVTVIDEKKEIREVRAQYHQAPYASLDITGKKGYVFIK